MKLSTTSCLLVLLALTLCGLGCKPIDTTPPDLNANPAQPDTAPAEEPEQPTDIGDAEAEIQMAITLPEQPEPNVTGEELRNARKDLDMLTVMVTPPYPAQLNLRLGVALNKNLKGSPVAMRIKIMRDQEVIANQAVVVGPKPNRTAFEYAFDAMAGLPAAPQTMLIHAQAELILLPAGTDPASVDPATITGTPDNSGTLLSNPARIEFAQPAPSA